jgi:hypothetical protein
VQFGLDLQYPPLRHKHSVFQFVSVHRRSPGIPVASSPPACWPPSPCTGLSPARSTTRPPPHLRPSADDRPAPARVGCPRR